MYSRRYRRTTNINRSPLPLHPPNRLANHLLSIEILLPLARIPHNLQPMPRAQAMLPQLLPARVDIATSRTRRTRHARRGIVHALGVLGAVRAVAEALAADGAGEFLVGFAVHA